MFYEDMTNQVALKDNVRKLIADFYNEELTGIMKTDELPKQLEAISTFNTISLAYINRNASPEVIDKQFYAIMTDLDIIFRQASDQDLFLVRLEGFLVRLNLLFGKEFMDEFTEDFINYLCSITPSRKYLHDPFVETKTTKKQEAHYRYRLTQLLNIHPYLWMVPFFTEAFVAWNKAMVARTKTRMKAPVGG